MQEKNICCYLNVSNMLIDPDIPDNDVYITTPEQSEAN